MCNESGVSLLRMRSACHPSGSATASMVEPSNPGCSLMPPSRLAQSSSMCTGMCLQTRAPTFTASSAAAWKKVRQIPSCVCPSCAQTVVLYKTACILSLNIARCKISSQCMVMFWTAMLHFSTVPNSSPTCLEAYPRAKLASKLWLHCHSLIHTMIHFIAQLHCYSQQGLL